MVNTSVQGQTLKLNEHLATSQFRQISRSAEIMSSPKLNKSFNRQKSKSPNRSPIITSLRSSIPLTNQFVNLTKPRKQLNVRGRTCKQEGMSTSCGLNMAQPPGTITQKEWLAGTIQGNGSKGKLNKATLNQESSSIVIDNTKKKQTDSVEMISQKKQEEWRLTAMTVLQDIFTADSNGIYNRKLPEILPEKTSLGKVINTETKPLEDSADKPSKTISDIPLQITSNLMTNKDSVIPTELSPKKALETTLNIPVPIPPGTSSKLPAVAALQVVQKALEDDQTLKLGTPVASVWGEQSKIPTAESSSSKQESLLPQPPLTSLEAPISVDQDTVNVSLKLSTGTISMDDLISYVGMNVDSTCVDLKAGTESNVSTQPVKMIEQHFQEITKTLNQTCMNLKTSSMTHPDYQISDAKTQDTVKSDNVLTLNKKKLDDRLHSNAVKSEENNVILVDSLITNKVMLDDSSTPVTGKSDNPSTRDTDISPSIKVISDDPPTLSKVDLNISSALNKDNKSKDLYTPKKVESDNSPTLNIAQVYIPSAPLGEISRWNKECDDSTTSNEINSYDSSTDNKSEYGDVSNPSIAKLKQVSCSDITNSYSSSTPSLTFSDNSTTLSLVRSDVWSTSNIIDSDNQLSLTFESDNSSFTSITKPDSYQPQNTSNSDKPPNKYKSDNLSLKITETSNDPSNSNVVDREDTKIVNIVKSGKLSTQNILSSVNSLFESPVLFESNNQRHALAETSVDQKIKVGISTTNQTRFVLSSPPAKHYPHVGTSPTLQLSMSDNSSKMEIDKQKKCSAFSGAPAEVVINTNLENGQDDREGKILTTQNIRKNYGQFSQQISIPKNKPRKVKQTMRGLTRRRRRLASLKYEHLGLTQKSVSSPEMTTFYLSKSSCNGVIGCPDLSKQSLIKPDILCRTANKAKQKSSDMPVYEVWPVRHCWDFTSSRPRVDATWNRQPSEIDAEPHRLGMSASTTEKSQRCLTWFYEETQRLGSKVKDLEAELIKISHGALTYLEQRRSTEMDDDKKRVKALENELFQTGSIPKGDIFHRCTRTGVERCPHFNSKATQIDNTPDLAFRDRSTSAKIGTSQTTCGRIMPEGENDHVLNSRVPNGDMFQSFTYNPPTKAERYSFASHGAERYHSFASPGAVRNQRLEIDGTERCHSCASPEVERFHSGTSRGAERYPILTNTDSDRKSNDILTTVKERKSDESLNSTVKGRKSDYSLERFMSLANTEGECDGCLTTDNTKVSLVKKAGVDHVTYLVCFYCFLSFQIITSYYYFK